jgi:hypothetical protein
MTYIIAYLSALAIASPLIPIPQTPPTVPHKLTVPTHPLDVLVEHQTAIRHVRAGWRNFWGYTILHISGGRLALAADLGGSV